MRKTGSRFGFCPSCKLYLHHAFLVVSNTMTAQKVGLVCDGCGQLNVSMTRDRRTFQITNHYVRPGFHVESASRVKPGSKFISDKSDKDEELGRSIP